MVHVYILSLQSRPDRLKNVIQELNAHNLEYTVIEAFTPEKNEVRQLAIGAQKGDDAYSVYHTIACLATHLSAYKRMIQDNRDEAIIMEDDVILHKDFSKLWENVRANFPDRADLVYLCCIHGIVKRRVEWAGKEKEQKNLIKRNDPIIWGAQCYWLTLSLAERAYHILHRPAAESYFKPTQYTSELISNLAIPYMTVPLLAIEDPFLISEIRQRSSGFPDFVEWGFENYGSDKGQWRSDIISYAKGEGSSFNNIDLSIISDVALTYVSKLLLDSESKVKVRKEISSRLPNNFLEKEICSHMETYMNLYR